MSFHRWCSLTLLLACGWLSQSSVIAATDRPNIVLCMTDDQGWGDVSYNGLTAIKTPHLDAMAAAGLRFDRFYAAAPVCSPTRASVLTGRHPNRSGVFLYGFPLRKEEVSIAQLLKDAGYATGHFGKWHLNGVRGPGKVIPADDPLSPGAFGFEEWLSVSNFFEIDWTLSRRGTPEPFKGDGSDYIVQEAVTFIEAAAKKKKPSLTLIWYGNPHSPHKPLDKDKEAAGGSAYYGEMVGIDRSMGTLRAELRRLGLAENTIVLFCSDNGAIPQGSTGGLRGRKGATYEGGVRVPGILEWPARIKAGRTTDVPAVTSDIFPTIVDLLGLEVQGAVMPLDGISLVPLIEGTMKERPTPIGFWHHNGRGAFTMDVGAAALTDNRYKLHRTAKGNYELYDLIEDRNEKYDLAQAKPDVIKAMNAQLEAWQNSVVASFEGKDYPAK